MGPQRDGSEPLPGLIEETLRHDQNRDYTISQAVSTTMRHILSLADATYSISNVFLGIPLTIITIAIATALAIVFAVYC